MTLANKILLFPLTRLVIGLGVFAVASSAWPSVNALLHLENARSGPIPNAEGAASALFALFVLGRYVERRPASAWGLPRARAFPQLGLGFGIGAAMLLATVGVIALIGGYHLRGLAPLPAGQHHVLQMARATLVFLFIAVGEEVVARGIIFRVLEEGVGTYAALAMSALFFGFGHMFNPHASWVSSVAISLEAGFMLGCAYTWARSLWFPIGIHWAWNLFEGPVLGAPVSGTAGYQLVDASWSGSALWTGGTFGPEAGLVAVVIGTALGASFLVATRKRGEVRGMGGWRKQPSDVPSAHA